MIIFPLQKTEDSIIVLCGDIVHKNGYDSWGCRNDSNISKKPIGFITNNYDNG